MNPQLDYITNNIIIGAGEVPSIQTDKGIAWVYPGGRLTYDREEAVALALRLDALVSANLLRYKRRLFRK